MLDSDPRNTDLEIRVIAPSATVRGRLSDIWKYRELLVGMVRKDLKVRYKGSILGFLWSMLNPAFTMVIYYVAFQVLLGAGIPRFPIYLMSGLLVWNLFSASVLGSAGSVLGAGHLVNKVYFPREVLPLAVIGAALVHFGLQSLVLIGAVLVSGHDISWEYLPAAVLGLVALVVFAAALAVLFSAVAVYARDVSHLLEIAFMGWIWLTPIVYSANLQTDKLADHGWPEWLARLNPVTNVTLVFQRTFYGLAVPEDQTRSTVPDHPMFWYVSGLLIMLAASWALFVVAMKVFNRLQGDFAEEI